MVLSKSEKSCLTCGRGLVGRQRKFCSPKCEGGYKPNVCGCGKSIGRKSAQCKRCAARNRPKRSKRKYYCQACGVEISQSARARCRKCAGRRLWLTHEKYHALAHKKGIEWLGPWVASAKKTLWRCKSGHEWEVSYAGLKNTTHNGCRKCFATRLRHPASDYHALARQRGWEWLGPEVSNVTIKTLWKCECGHCWEARFQAIQSGNGCPYCAQIRTKFSRLNRKSTEDYHALAAKRSINWAEESLPKDVRAKTLWKCAIGHIIEASYEQIRLRKTVCKRCNFCVDCGTLIPIGRLKKCEECRIKYLQRIGAECIDGCGTMMSAPRLICLSCRNKRDWQDDDYRRNMTGENSPHWKGGISFDPYGPRWTDELKEEIRKRDEHTCAISSEVWQVGQDKFHVHHINYCKTDNQSENLITLCTNCHMRTNFSRDLWQKSLRPIALRRVMNQDRKLGSTCN